MALNAALLGLNEISSDSRREVEVPRVRCSAAPPLSFLGTALAILFGNLLTMVVAAVIYALLKLL
jgi:hypothetical protein